MLKIHLEVIFGDKSALVKTKGTINNGQLRDTDNIGHEDKKKTHNTVIKMELLRQQALEHRTISLFVRHQPFFSRTTSTHTCIKKRDREKQRIQMKQI